MYKILVLQTAYLSGLYTMKAALSAIVILSFRFHHCKLLFSSGIFLIKSSVQFFKIFSDFLG